jgi:hypothetical protein
VCVLEERGGFILKSSQPAGRRGRKKVAPTPGNCMTWWTPDDDAS